LVAVRIELLWIYAHENDFRNHVMLSAIQLQSGMAG
jgi:hypothetical protein